MYHLIFFLASLLCVPNWISSQEIQSLASFSSRQETFWGISSIQVLYLLGGITWWRYLSRLDLTSRILCMLMELLGVISVCSHQHAMFKQIVLLCLPVGRFALDLGQILLPLTAAWPNLCQRYLLMSGNIRIRPVQQVFITLQTWS